MSLNYHTFIILMANLIPQVFGRSFYGCGEPGVDRLMNFAVTSNTTEVDSESKHYSHGTTIEYECIGKQDVLINNSKVRVCTDGKWLPKMPRCGQYYQLSKK